MPEEAMVKLRFEAKPGRYPPHKGGRTWLHDKGGARRVPHATSKDGFTTKIAPRVVLSTGDTVDVPEPLAETMLKRYECFTRVGTRKASKDKGGEA